MPALRLSILDQSPVSEGMTPADAIRRSIDLARFAEAHGFTRFWVAEHHGTPMLAGTSPELLIALIAEATTRIRVGSGGVMLPHYSPLKVAETFGVIAGLHPGRIDLGLGRAAGTDPLTAFALQRDRRYAAPDDFPEQLRELLAFIRDGFPSGHRFAALRGADARAEAPTPWLLGSSPQSGIWAAEHGLPYAFADFIAPIGAAIARHYRESFVPSRLQLEPEVVVAVWAVAAATDAEAQRLASSAQVAFLQFLGGQPIKVPPVALAQHLIEHRPETLQLFSQRRRAVIGSPQRVRDEIERIAEEYGAQEAMIVTITFDHEDRKRSYGLIAEAFN